MEEFSVMRADVLSGLDRSKSAAPNPTMCIARLYSEPMRSRSGAGRESSLPRKGESLAGLVDDPDDGEAESHVAGSIVLLALLTVCCKTPLASRRCDPLEFSRVLLLLRDLHGRKRRSHDCPLHTDTRSALNETNSGVRCIGCP